MENYTQKNSYINGAFVFDYTQTNPKLIVTINDELLWICVVHNVGNMLELRDLTDDFRDNVPIYDRFVDDNLNSYKENVKKSGKSEEEYLADFRLTKDEFEKLKERICEKYGKEGAIELDFPILFVDTSQGSYISSQICGIHPDFNYILDPFDGYDVRHLCDLDFDFADNNPDVILDYLTNYDSIRNVEHEYKKFGKFVINDKMFESLKDNLPTLFEIGAMGHRASMNAEWLPSDVIEDLFRAKGVDGENFAKDNQLIYEGNDDYKSEYARFLIQRACSKFGINKIEFDLSFDNVAKDKGIQNTIWKRDGYSDINWDESEDMLQRNQVILFHSKHNGSDDIDADFVCSRVYITSSCQSHNAEFIAKNKMKENPDLMFAEISLQGDSFVIDNPLLSAQNSNEKSKKIRKQ